MEKPIFVKYEPAKQISWKAIVWWCVVSTLVSGALVTLALI